MECQHVQNSPHDLDVRSKQHDYRTCKTQQVIKCNLPTCVAIHDNGDIYVGSWDHCIYVFDQTGHLKNTIGSRGRGDGEFIRPNGISIKGDVLYVAECHNHRIQKLTSRGEFIHKFGHKGSDQGEFNDPQAVIVDSKNRLIVSDGYNHRIQIFNEEGGWLLTIDGKGTGDSSFVLPHGLALDPQGNIHVAAISSINVFTSDGAYVRMYNRISSLGIAVDDEGNACVSMGYGKCLSIFDHRGKRIHKVGSFENPQGIALDPRDGSVFVADIGASSVLKFSVV